MSQPERRHLGYPRDLSSKCSEMGQPFFSKLVSTAKGGFTNGHK